MGSVVDACDKDEMLRLVNAKQDSVVAAACGAVSLKLPTEGLAEPLRVFCQGHGYEFNDSSSNLGRKSIQSANGRGTQFDVIGRCH